MATTNNVKMKAEAKPVLNGAAHLGSEENAKPAEAPMSPELLAQIATIRTRIQASVGEVVLSMLNLARYRNQSVADLMHLVVTPLLHDRIAIARTVGEGKIEETAGIAIWASVSDEVDAKIREQVKAAAFPVRLKGEDWVSGETAWLLDVIAPTQQSATAGLANFKQVVKDKPVRIHPIVTQLVDRDVLEKMKVRAAVDPEANAGGESPAERAS